MTLSAATPQACDCTCHESEQDARLCSCCPDSGRWADTCEGEALTYGGHGRCRNGICWERLAEEAWKNGDLDG